MTSQLSQLSRLFPYMYPLRLQDEKKRECRTSKRKPVKVVKPVNRQSGKGFNLRQAAALLRPSILSKLPGPPTPLELTTAEVRLRAEAHEGTADG